MSSEGQGNKWASVNRKIDSAKLEGVMSSQTLELNSFFWLCRSGLWLISTWNPCLAQACHKTSPHLTTAEWRKCCHISSVLFSYSVLENERCMWLFLRFETWKWAQHEVRWTSELEKKEGRRSMAESQGLEENLPLSGPGHYVNWSHTTQLPQVWIMSELWRETDRSCITSQFSSQFHMQRSVLRYPSADDFSLPGCCCSSQKLSVAPRCHITYEQVMSSPSSSVKASFHKTPAFKMLLLENVPFLVEVSYDGLNYL